MATPVYATSVATKKPIVTAYVGTTSSPAVKSTAAAAGTAVGGRSTTVNGVVGSYVPYAGGTGGAFAPYSGGGGMSIAPAAPISTPVPRILSSGGASSATGSPGLTPQSSINNAPVSLGNITGSQLTGGGTSDVTSNLPSGASSTDASGAYGAMAGIKAGMMPVPAYGSVNNDGTINKFDPNTGKSSNPDFDIQSIIDKMNKYDESAPDFNRAAIQKQVESDAHLQEYQQKVNDYTAQLNTITAESQAASLSVTGQGRGIPEAIIGGQQAQIAKEAAIRALPIAAQLAAAQGNLNLAQQHVDTMAKLMIQDAEDKYNNWAKTRDTVVTLLTSSEKRRLDQMDLQKANERDDAKTLAKARADAISASLGAPQSVINAIMTATTPEAIASFAAPYNADMQLKQAQIQKTNADAQAALQSDAAVSPEVLQGMLNAYKATGTIPAFGNSAKSPLRAQFYAALGGADGTQIVSDANTNKAVRAGLNTAYKTQQNQYSANQTAVATLEQQLTLAKKYSDQVSRSGSPLVNKYILSTKSGIFGDADTAALNNIVTTASYELAKILSGSSASIGGATVSSQEDAKNLLNAAMSNGQFNEVLDLMHQEAAFRLQSQKDTLNSLQGDLSNIGGLTSALKSDTTSTPTSGTLGSGITWTVIQLPYGNTLWQL